MELGKCEFVWEEVMNTKGITIVSDGESLVVCHRCGLKDPKLISLHGDNLMILYARGDLAALMNHCDADCVENIIYERNMDGLLRVLNFARFRRLINMRETE